MIRSWIYISCLEVFEPVVIILGMRNICRKLSPKRYINDLGIDLYFSDLSPNWQAECLLAEKRMRNMKRKSVTKAPMESSRSGLFNAHQRLELKSSSTAEPFLWPNQGLDGKCLCLNLGKFRLERERHKTHLFFL
jgi:hypothetical protein